MTFIVRTFWRLALALAGCGLAAAPVAGADLTSAYVGRNERHVLREFVQFLSLRNVATDAEDIDRNATALVEMLQARGLSARKLSAGEGKPVSVYGERLTPGATRTVLFYAHFDGQPAGQAGWRSDPWRPVLRSKDGVDVTGLIARDGSPLDGETRIYARSASDDKGAIMAFLAALDALEEQGAGPAVNVKVFYEGEEEQGSPNLTRVLSENRALLAADLVIFGDGPVHASRRQQIFYGARGAMAAELTVFGPTRPLHSGHYGNWAPNPALMLSRLLSGVRDDNARVLIPGFYDDVTPLTAADRKALAALPAVEGALRNDLGLARTELGERLLDSTSQPAVNIVGLRSGQVGLEAAQAIPTEAQASLDFRLVPGQTPDGVRKRFEGFLEQQGWTLTGPPPTQEQRLRHPKIAMLRWNPGYAASKTPIDTPVARGLAKAVGDGADVIHVPMLGGSVPMSLFAEALAAPVIGVPIANHDNNQHGANENLRLQNLRDGIELYARLLTELDW